MALETSQDAGQGFGLAAAVQRQRLAEGQTDVVTKGLT